MKIGIDARLYGLKHAGIGRYTQNLIGELAKIDKKNEYTLFVTNPKDIDQLPNNFKLIKANIRHYTFAEQTKFLSLLNSQKLDFVHFTHFNVPIFYSKPFMVTIHDLLWHKKIGGNVTTLSPIIYALKYLGYRATVRNAVFRSKKIITPTYVVSKSIQKHFKLSDKKFVVTHEAADQIFSTKPPVSFVDQVITKFGLVNPYIIYTGSLYPHKNVDTLIQSLKYLPANLNLVIVSSRNIFTTKTEDFARSKGLSSRVKFLGYQTDKTLVALYQKAEALVLPSLSEGFGLTGLEAMTAGLPVVCSQHSVLTEIYGEAPIYSDTTNPERLAESINSIFKNKKLANIHKNLGFEEAKKYSWKKMATKTLGVYNQLSLELAKK